MWYLIGLVAVVGVAMAARKYLHSRPITFTFEGARYVHHPDGSFTSEGGAPVTSPQLEVVKAHWKKTEEVEID